MLWLEVCREEMTVFYLRMCFLVMVWVVDTYAELLISCSSVLLVAFRLFSRFFAALTGMTNSVRPSSKHLVSALLH